jgi:hypothetical protein
MKNKTIPQSLIAPLNAFLTSVNTAISIYRKKNFKNLEEELVAVHNIGGRYAKLAFHEKDKSGDWKAMSVYCFVDLSNGNILKGSWKAPVANGVRGNLNDTDILTKVTVYGVGYIRGGGGYDTISHVLTNLGK